MPEYQEQPIPSPKTPNSLVKLVEFYVGCFVSNASHPEITGLNNLEKIPPHRPVIIVNTHLSDIDTQAVIAALGNRFDFVITGQSFLKEAKILGEKRFYPLSFRKGRKGPPSAMGIFNPQEYQALQKATQEGKTPIIAAHNPTYDWKLPPRGGVAAVFLAQLTNAVIIPVAVNIHSEEPVAITHHGLKKNVEAMLSRQKPPLSLHIGEHLDLVDSSTAEVAKELVKEPANNALMRQILKPLKEKSAHVMQSLANMLPEAKRGPWQAKLEE